LISEFNKSFDNIKYIKMEVHGVIVFGNHSLEVGLAFLLIKNFYARPGMQKNGKFFDKHL